MEPGIYIYTDQIEVQSAVNTDIEIYHSTGIVQYIYYTITAGV
jgi:hypothetical protein